MHALIECILVVRAALDAVFQDEFHNGESQNIPTQLEKIKMTESGCDSFKNVKFVLKPQKALEGEKYVNLSLLPLVINEVYSQHGLCEGAVDEHTQQDLYQLMCVMVDDFKNRWGESMHYSNEMVRASGRCQVGIPTYAFWVTTLDPCTKKTL